MKNYLFCPNCGQENSLSTIKKEEKINIKGTEIPVISKVVHCSSCDIDFAPLDETFDVIVEARAKYRKMFNIPSPDDIYKFMEEHNFSLRDMEALTGIAFKTIDRYLKGGIPDPSNAKLLSIILEFPEVLLEKITESNHFDSNRFNKIKDFLSQEVKEYFHDNCPKCQITGEFEMLINEDNIELTNFKNITDNFIKVYTAKLSPRLFENYEKNLLKYLFIANTIYPISKKNWFVTSSTCARWNITLTEDFKNKDKEKVEESYAA